MPNDRVNAQVDAAAYGSGFSSNPWDGEDPLGLGWWLTGGASLLVWTGIAVLLTSV